MSMYRILTPLLALLGATTVDAANPIVELDTSLGKIKIELYQDKAPITVKNFLQYVDDKHYDGLIFHRVIDGFMIQGGGMDADMKERKTRDPIKNESGNGVPNKVGYIAMARTQVLDSATSQFFINVKDNGFLDDNKYCAFGKVIEGLDVVNKIKAVETGNKGGHQNVPTQAVVIKSVRRVEK